MAKGEQTRLARERRAMVRRQEQKRVRELRAELRRAKRDRTVKLRKTRASITAGRLRLRASVKAFRKEWREYVNALIDRQRARARAAWQTKLAKALAAPARKVALRGEALRSYRADLARIRAAAKKKKAPATVRKAYEARSESDDMVRGNLPPELHPVWKKLKNKVKTRVPRKTRTEAFLEWCAEHPDDVLRAQWGDDDQARLEKELREAEAAAHQAKKAGWQPTERELDWLAAAGL